MVIAIIAVLASLLLPALHKAREAGTNILCKSNLKQLGVWGYMYADDYGGVLPVNGGDPDDKWAYWEICNDDWYRKNPNWVAHWSDEGMRRYVPEIPGKNACDRTVVDPTILHCPQLTSANLPRHWYRVDFDYSLSYYLGGWNTNWDGPDAMRRTPPAGELRLTILTSEAFWFADGHLSTDPWNMGSNVKATGLDPDRWSPWPWKSVTQSFTHPNAAANFVFGDGHVKAVTHADASARDHDAWTGKDQWRD